MLVFEQLDSFLVQLMLDHIGADLVINAESMKVLQRLGPASKVIVNLKAAAIIRKLLQLAQEGKVFSGILVFVRRCFANHSRAILTL